MLEMYCLRTVMKGLEQFHRLNGSLTAPIAVTPLFQRKRPIPRTARHFRRPAYNCENRRIVPFRSVRRVPFSAAPLHEYRPHDVSGIDHKIATAGNRSPKTTPRGTVVGIGREYRCVNWA